MAEEGENYRFFDSFDVWYFIGGGLAALVALFLIKNILEPQHHHWHHNYHHHHNRPIPIAREVEKGIIYSQDSDGKFY